MKRIPSPSPVSVETEPLDSKASSESKDAGIVQMEVSTVREKDEDVILQPVDQNPYELLYTCLLLPRFSSHHLLGDITGCLQSCMRQICIAFGWRLEFLSIEADYMHWTLRVPLATSVAHFMQVIREQTCQRLFADFPRLKSDNPSSDFWALGYLIISGSQPHPAEIIQRFIRLTRQQQGDGRGE